MNQYIREYKLSKLLGEFSGPSKFFIDKLTGCVNVNSKDYPGCFIWKKDGVNLCLQDPKNLLFHIDFSKIWLVFEKEYSMKYREIQELTSYLVNEHFKLGSYTTNFGGPFSMSIVNEHFKLGSYTTISFEEADALTLD